MFVSLLEQIMCTFVLGFLVDDIIKIRAKDAEIAGWRHDCYIFHKNFCTIIKSSNFDALKNLE